MDADEARTIGRRLTLIRKARGKPLRVIAGLAGMSKSQLDRIERGERALDKLSEIMALANALEIAPSELLRLPVPAPGNGGTDGAVVAVRRALVAVELDKPGGQVVPVEVHTSIATGRDLDELLPLAVTLHVHITRMWLDNAGATVDLRHQVALPAHASDRIGGLAASLKLAPSLRCIAARDRVRRMKVRRWTLMVTYARSAAVSRRSGSGAG